MCLHYLYGLEHYFYPPLLAHMGIPRRWEITITNLCNSNNEQRVQIFQLLIKCYSAQPSKTPDGVCCAHTRQSPLCSHLMESAVLTVSVHCTRVNTTPLLCGYPNKGKYKKSDTNTTGTRFSKECTSVSYFLWWVPLPEVSKTATAARDPVYTTWACGDAAQSRQRRSLSRSQRLRPPHNTKHIRPPSKSPQSLNNSNTVQKSKCKVSFETKSTLLIVSPPE